MVEVDEWKDERISREGLKDNVKGRKKNVENIRMIKHRIACPADSLGLRWIVFKRRPRLLSRNDKSCG